MVKHVYVCRMKLKRCYDAASRLEPVPYLHFFGMTTFIIQEYIIYQSYVKFLREKKSRRLFKFYFLILRFNRRRDGFDVC